MLKWTWEIVEVNRKAEWKFNQFTILQNSNTINMINTFFLSYKRPYQTHNAVKRISNWTGSHIQSVFFGAELLRCSLSLTYFAGFINNWWTFENFWTFASLFCHTEFFLIISRIFFGRVLGSLMCTIMSSVNKDSLITSFPICIPLIFFSCQIVPVSALSTVFWLAQLTKRMKGLES